MPKAAVCTAALLHQEVASPKLDFRPGSCSTVCITRNPVGYGSLLSGMRARERPMGLRFWLYGNTSTQTLWPCMLAVIGPENGPLSYERRLPAYRTM